MFEKSLLDQIEGRQWHLVIQPVGISPYIFSYKFALICYINILCYFSLIRIPFQTFENRRNLFVELLALGTSSAAAATSPLSARCRRSTCWEITRITCPPVIKYRVNFLQWSHIEPVNLLHNHYSVMYIPGALWNYLMWNSTKAKI